jgi:hypothetical protein
MLKWMQLFIVAVFGAKFATQRVRVESLEKTKNGSIKQSGNDSEPAGDIFAHKTCRNVLAYKSHHFLFEHSFHDRLVCYPKYLGFMVCPSWRRTQEPMLLDDAARCV